MQPDQPLGIREIAILAEVSDDTARRWRDRGRLPPPSWPGTANGQPVWSFADVKDWLARTGRNAPRDDAPVIVWKRRPRPKTLVEVLAATETEG